MMVQELEAENKALWEEKKLASSILTKYKDEEKIVDDALRDIFTERRRIKELQVFSQHSPASNTLESSQKP